LEEDQQEGGRERGCGRERRAGGREGREVFREDGRWKGRGIRRGARNIRHRQGASRFTKYGNSVRITSEIFGIVFYPLDRQNLLRLTTRGEGEEEGKEEWGEDERGEGERERQEVGDRQYHGNELREEVGEGEGEERRAG
jgi:hypothetical protein